MKSNYLAAVIALCLGTGTAMAQDADQTKTTQTENRASVFSTSNNSSTNTKRVQQMTAVSVSGQSAALGGGNMTVQDAPKAVSTITREAIEKVSPSSDFTSIIATVPGVNFRTNDFTGLNDGHYTLRGFNEDEIGMTVNGAPVNDAATYALYSTEYGDAENMGDITVSQGYPDLGMATASAVGGSVAWVTLTPSHKAGVDVSQSFGSNSFRRSFVRLNTGDTGPVRSWLSYSDNRADLWRGSGKMRVTKVDGKSVWTIDDKNSIAASLQYNREFRHSYLNLTKEEAREDYDQNYARQFVPGGNPFANLDYYKLSTNPFISWIASLDGEFTLTDSLRLSVVPYFQYGHGGGGFSIPLFESATPSDSFLHANQDVSGDGVITDGQPAPGYAFFHSNTYRPGMLVKFSQDFGMNNTLEYGGWYERPRQQQGFVVMPVDSKTGAPSDLWGEDESVWLRYANGAPQRGVESYSVSNTRKAFVTDTWTPNDQWTFTLGGAYLWMKRSGFNFSSPGSAVQAGGDTGASFHKFTPAGGVKFQLDDKNQFYLGVAKTFRPPTAGQILNNAVVSDPKYRVRKAETATTADLGWRFYGDKLSASVDAFATNFHNRTITGTIPGTQISTYQTLPSVHTRGINAEGSYAFADHWQVYAAYSYTQARNQTNISLASAGTLPDGTVTDGIYYTRGKQLVNSPRNLANASLNFDYGQFWASLSARYTGAYWADWSNTEKAGGFTTFNLNAGWKFHDFNAWFHKPYIKLNAFNLFDRKALTATASVSNYLADGNTVVGSNGATLGTYGTPQYNLLQPRAFMVTFGASFD
ncbi:TonB-dependent receptor [Frateuria defendens]|uniref:TonB-dependent receptor n=1 Tax=Frateuria defendens TaxID=2219559 RepID=UPI00066FE810|nr:TonB-dependent receptor [Frateuria defendens]